MTPITDLLKGACEQWPEKPFHKIAWNVEKQRLVVTIFNGENYNDFILDDEPELMQGQRLLEVIKSLIESGEPCHFQVEPPQAPAFERIDILPDGDMWSVLQGSNIQEGKAAFGKTVMEAVANWITEHGEPENPYVK